jgi:hypothetical protein
MDLVHGLPGSGADHGQWRKDDLVRKKIVPQSVNDDIKDKIIARQR